MHTSLHYGERLISLILPDEALILEASPMEPLPDPEGDLRRALAEPIASPPLSQIARGRSDACVVISDITRPVPNQLLLPPLLRTLEEAGIPRYRIHILVATGMHRPNEGAELESMVGSWVMDNYRIANHECRNRGSLRQVGRLGGGPIELNTIYLDADLKILTGLIEPHMYAGYSGGRKSLLPGIASLETLRYLHSFAMIAHPGVTNCKLAGNPFHEAGEEVMAMAGADFLVNVVINKQRQITGIFAGHPSQAHQAGCALVREHTVHQLEGPADLVITSAGGYPLDATFYQVSKGLIMARNMLRPGGSIVVACECREGLGSPEYCQMVAQGFTPHQFNAHHGQPQNFIIDQWCLQTTYQAIETAGRVYCYSENLDYQTLAGIGVEKIGDIQAKVDELLPSHGKVVAVPQGPYVVGLPPGA
ncbi:MAG: nickel-dependent lactate racemase [Thermodesulfobacteriota bacterium]